MTLHNEQQVKTAVEELRRAVRIKGPAPHLHDKTMARHRKEWPTLWRAIDDLLRG